LFIFLPYVCPFLNFSCWTIYIDDFVNKTSLDKGGAYACGNGAIGYHTVQPWSNKSSFSELVLSFLMSILNVQKFDITLYW